MDLALRVEPAWTIGLFVALAATVLALVGRERMRSVVWRAAAGIALALLLALGIEVVLAWRTFRGWRTIDCCSTTF